MSVSKREEKVSLVNSSAIRPAATPAHNSPVVLEDSPTGEHVTQTPGEIRRRKNQEAISWGEETARRRLGRGVEIAGENWRLTRTEAKNDMIRHGPRISRRAS